MTNEDKTTEAALTVRDVIKQLLDCDLDADACFSFHGSDPIPIVAVYDTGEEQVVLTDSKEEKEVPEPD